MVIVFGACQKPVVIRHNPIEQLITDTKHWEYVYCTMFSDGGSLAYGFLNDEGSLVYLFAECPMVSPEKRRILLKRSYNDREAIVIDSGSKLEAKVLHLLDTLMDYSWAEGHLFDLGELVAMLQDRSAPFPSPDLNSRQDAGPDNPSHSFAPLKFQPKRKTGWQQ